MKVSEGTLRDPKGIQGGACDVWNYENKWKICVKAEKGEFAKQISLLQIDKKTVEIYVKPDNRRLFLQRWTN